MKSIIDFVTKNKIGMGIVAIVAAGFIIMAGLNGCEMTDFVKVKVPLQVQKATNSPPKVTLTEAPGIMAAYIRGGEKFKDNIARGYEWLGFLAAATSTGIELGKSSIPGGAIGLSLLTLAGGIFIKGPGTAKEKNASYNKGLAKGQEMANLALAALQSPKKE